MKTIEMRLDEELQARIKADLDALELGDGRVEEAREVVERVRGAVERHLVILESN